MEKLSRFSLRTSESVILLADSGAVQRVNEPPIDTPLLDSIPKPDE